MKDERKRQGLCKEVDTYDKDWIVQIIESVFD